jgi:ParB-like chromosome segregation protein Spo0J
MVVRDSNPASGDHPMKITPSPILRPLPTDEYEQLRESIRELGVQVPLLITDDGMIIDGHDGGPCRTRSSA